MAKDTIIFSLLFYLWNFFEALNLLFEKVSLTIEDAAITFLCFFAAITF